MSILHFFYWTYYFNDNLSMTFVGWGYWAIVGLLVVMIIASVVLPAKTKKLPFLQRQIVMRSNHLFSLVGWLGLIWLMFRYEGIPYLSWRVWPAILTVYSLIQIGRMIKFVKIDFPARRASKITGQEKEIYLRRYLGKK
jgi:hypothetical protein